VVSQARERRCRSAYASGKNLAQSNETFEQFAPSLMHFLARSLKPIVDRRRAARRAS
jgi:hypothetical protein